LASLPVFPLKCTDGRPEAIDFNSELMAAHADNDALRNDLCITLGKIGQTLAAAGDRAGALDLHRETLAMRRALAARDPENTGWHGDVTWSLARISDLQQQLGQASASADTDGSEL
jgi:hypothetical protein